MHYRVVRSILGLSTLNGTGTPPSPVVTIKSVSRHCQRYPRSKSAQSENPRPSLHHLILKKIRGDGWLVHSTKKPHKLCRIPAVIREIQDLEPRA